MRLLVCGGRDYLGYSTIKRYLDALHEKTLITCLIQGKARGADTIARTWAIENGIPVEDYPANWTEHRQKAGAIRNTEMLYRSNPDYWLAFPGGTGTADMVKKLRKAGIPGQQIEE